MKWWLISGGFILILLAGIGLGFTVGILWLLMITAPNLH
jgi:hypothetical protein